MSHGFSHLQSPKKHSYHVEHGTFLHSLNHGEKASLSTAGYEEYATGRPLLCLLLRILMQWSAQHSCPSKAVNPKFVCSFLPKFHPCHARKRCLRGCWKVPSKLTQETLRHALVVRPELLLQRNFGVHQNDEESKPGDTRDLYEGPADPGLPSSCSLPLQAL